MKVQRKILIIFVFIFVFSLTFLAKANQQEKPINFYSPQKGIYILDVNTSLCKNCIQPYLSEKLETVEFVAEKQNATAAINAGFFDPANTKTISYVKINNLIAADPLLNSNLMNNEKIREYIPAILNRTELRWLNCNNNTNLFDIAQHNTPISDNCEIQHSIQAGPALFPVEKIEEESFISKKKGKVIRESASVLQKAARSAVGIKGNHVIFIAISNENPMTIKELAKFTENLEFDKVMAFDGGSSTSLYVNLPETKKFVLTSAKNNAARRVKSIILIKNNSNSTNSNK